ncbi:putative transmembrane protein [Senna tora]|uniref:Putative transmembrane protein n=1 Tax=Senna tora TaxID=362788 RepID=A0A834X1N9_9FABA|nr:putative transmembrane protein [Senna tora]
MEITLDGTLMKMTMFMVIQALVYLILSSSSAIFSNTNKRSNSFKPARSASVRRILAVLADFSPEGESSPNYSSKCINFSSDSYMHVTNVYSLS